MMYAIYLYTYLDSFFSFFLSQFLPVPPLPLSLSCMLSAFHIYMIHVLFDVYALCVSFSSTQINHCSIVYILCNAFIQIVYICLNLDVSFDFKIYIFSSRTLCACACTVCNAIDLVYEQCEELQNLNVTFFSFSFFSDEIYNVIVEYNMRLFSLSRSLNESMFYSNKYFTLASAHISLFE